MEGLDPTFVGFIYSIAGVVVGWLLTQLGQWVSIRHEDKRNLKQVIYNLLETYHWLVRSDFDNVSILIGDRLITKVPEAYRTEELKTEIKTVYMHYAINNFKPYIINSLDSIETNYQLSIETLSKIDPLTAFSLRGKTTVLKRLEIFDEVAASYKNIRPENADTADEMFNKAIEQVKPNIIKEELNDLREIILDLSKKVGLGLKWKAQRLLNEIDYSMSSELEDNVDDVMSLIMTNKQSI
jgi:hypothetical protein